MVVVSTIAKVWVAYMASRSWFVTRILSCRDSSLAIYNGLSQHCADQHCCCSWMFLHITGSQYFMNMRMPLTLSPQNWVGVWRRSCHQRGNHLAPSSARALTLGWSIFSSQHFHFITSLDSPIQEKTSIESRCVLLCCCKWQAILLTFLYRIVTFFYWVKFISYFHGRSYAQCSNQFFILLSIMGNCELPVSLSCFCHCIVGSMYLSVSPCMITIVVLFAGPWLMVLSALYNS